MKKIKKNQRFLSILLIMAIFSSLTNLSLFSTAAAESEGLNYSFANDLAGHAEGTITLNPKDDEQANYYLYWADDEGALEGYYNITSIDTSTEENSFSFLENVVIPPDATKLIAIKGDTESNDKSVANASYVFEIPASKQNKYTSDEKNLSFEALADTQVDQQSSVFYTYSEEHFAMALEDAAKRNVDFVTISGDCINNYQNGTSKEWQAFQKIIADSSFTNPIYETNGNHSMNSDREYGLEAYITATGQGVDTEGLSDVPYYEMTAENGDHFLFVALEGSKSVPTTDEFSDEQMDWLDETIAKYYNDGKHIFIFEHAFFHGWGPGDDKTEHYYSGGLRTTEDFPGNQRFLEIMNKYTEVFLYTGHSHLDLMYNWNYDNENGQSANMFHIPSTACTTHVTNGKLDYTMNYNDSQCYIVDSYDDMVVTYGLNVVDNLIYPQYSYIVETADYDHVPSTSAPTEPTEPTTESDKMIDVQVDNGTSYLYSDGAAVYFYNVDSGNYFLVDNKTGIAQIPENATNLTLYRFDGEIGKGNTSDKVTTYWNKYGPATRAEGQVIFYVGGSSKYSWKDGEVVYPSTPSTDPQAPTESEDPKEDTDEVTVYWAIPSGYTESGYTYKMNIKCADGSYPHSARTMTDTGKTYNGLALYEYTFSKEYAEEYDTLGISRIQFQGVDSKQVFQYQWELDDAITISELKDKVFVSPDEAPTGTVTATSDLWESLKEEPEVPEDNGEVTVYWAIPSGYTESGYTYKINIKCADGSYPHSARTMTDTGTTYNGLALYEYTFSKEYAEEYDTLGISRIQLQGVDSKQVFQYQWALDDAITISELKDMVFVSPDEAPTGTVTATSDLWESLKEEPEVPEDNGEVTVYWAIPSGYTESGYTYKMNIKCADGSYPHSARTMTDTGTTYNGLALYEYTFSKEYAEEYDTLGISRIQLQGVDSKQVFQYQWTLDDAITISELKDMVFVSPDEAPTGTVTATSDLWKSLDEKSEEIPEGYIEVEIDNQTSYLYDSGAVLYFYDNDTAEFYEVNIETGKALIPETATVLTLYRFDGELGKGNNSDNVTNYWNKYGPSERTKGQTIFYVAGSSKYGWKGGDSEEDTPIPEGFVKIEVIDTTSSGWIYGSGAVLFIYDTNTEATYRVVNGYAIIPETAVDLVLYRCDGSWGSGNKTDDVTTYWNKWELAPRSEDFTILSLSGDGKSNWMSAGTHDPEDDGTFYLVGYIDGADYEARDQKFDENGELEIVLLEDSYVYVVSSSNTSYWTNGWLGNEVTSATLYRAQSLSDPDKLFVPSGKIKFKLVVNDDGTITISYAVAPVELDKSELEIIKNINTLIGDVDSDGTVTVKDATLLQLYLAKMESIDSIDQYAADVYGNGEINVKCATMIQMYLAHFVDAFPASDDYVPDTSTLDNLILIAGNTLYTDYRYASFVAYSNLKAQYSKYKDVDVTTLSDEEYTKAYIDLLNAYERFNAMKTNNNVVTVYFCNDQSWSNVKAYIYNSETGKGINTLETAQGISAIKTLNCGAKIYCVTIDRSKWDKIIFTDGNEKRTVEIDIPTKNYMGYYLADSTVNDEGNIIPAMFKYNYDRI